MKHLLLTLIILVNILNGIAETSPFTQKDSLDAFTLTQWCALRKVGQHHLRLFLTRLRQKIGFRKPGIG
ncbi:MAG: hypothetical protein V4590_15070 [Bacteroidota bacterium]